MWYKNGNCFVHLYEKGQSQREPAFKIPLACLLSAKCEPMVQRFSDRSTTEEQSSRIDLYIPAPPTASLSQALQYHIATRNFFAWVCRRSMVGDYLGDALVALVESLREFRDDDADNFQDLLSYLDEEAYLDMSNHPPHALAILQLAEKFQFKDMYIDALAHCVGMSERLYQSPGCSVSWISYLTRNIPVILGLPCADMCGSAYQCRVTGAYPTRTRRSGSSAEPCWCHSL